MISRRGVLRFGTGTPSFTCCMGVCLSQGQHKHADPRAHQQLMSIASGVHLRWGPPQAPTHSAARKCVVNRLAHCYGL